MIPPRYDTLEPTLSGPASGRVQSGLLSNATLSAVSVVRRSSGLVRVGLATLVVLAGLYEVVWNETTLSLDGYSHLYNAFALQQIWNPHDTLFHEYYTPGSLLTPNWLATIALALLQYVLPYEACLKVFHVLLVVLCLGGLAYLLSGIISMPGAWPELICISLPMAFSTFLLSGFHGFQLGLGLSFFVIGALLRFGSRPPIRVQIALGVGLVAIYYSHPLTFFVCALFFTIRLVYDCWDRWSTHLAGIARRPRTIAELPWFILSAALPWIVPAAAFVEYSRMMTGGAYDKIFKFAHIRKAAEWFLDSDKFLALGPSTYGGVLFIFYCALLFGGYLLSLPDVLSRKGDRYGLHLLLFSVSLTGMFIVLPEQIGEGSVIKVRLLAYVVVSWMLVSCCGKAGRRLLCMTAWFCAAPYMLISFRQYHHAADFLRGPTGELSSLSTDIPAGSRIVVLSYDLTPANFESPVVRKIRPERHFASMLAVRTKSVLLNNYEGYTSQFPLRYRRTAEFGDIVNEYTFAADTSWRKVFAADTVSGVPVDYVVVWGVAKDSTKSWVRADEELLPLLNQNFEIVRKFEGKSRILLYRKSMHPSL